MTKIAMWSGPRSISTALMRSFENRPDTFVTDEPFYAHYLHKTGIDHPFSKEVMSDGNTDWNNVEDEITGRLLNIYANGEDYADVIESIWNDEVKYNNMKIAARKKYEQELNWTHWGEKFQLLLDNNINNQIN